MGREQRMSEERDFRSLSRRGESKKWERKGRTETLGTTLVLGLHGRSAITGKAFSSLTIIVQNVLVCNVVFIITKMFHFWNTLKSADFNGENNTSLDAITKIMKSSLFLTQELWDEFVYKLFTRTKIFHASLTSNSCISHGRVQDILAIRSWKLCQTKFFWCG